MAEFIEADGDAAAEAALQTDATGVGLAMDRTRSRPGGKGDEAADRFLAAQEALIAKQGHHLDAQFRILGLDHWSKRLRLALQALAILAAMLALSAVGWMAFEAAHADGLVVEAFAVPPSLIAQGTTGAVVAGDMLDRLAEIEAQAKSFYGSKVSDAWTAGSRIEVPETGLTLDELDRLFRRQFGHETHITGQVQLTPAGLALTARTGPGAAVRVEGPADQLPALTQKLAEAIHAKARPMTHTIYASQLGRYDEVRRLAQDVMGDPDASGRDKARAHNAMGNVLRREGRIDEALAQYRIATASPYQILHVTTYGNMAAAESELGHLARARDLLAASLKSMRGAGLDPSAADGYAHIRTADSLAMAGDYMGARAALAPFVGVKLAGNNSLDLQRERYATILAQMHEFRLARAYGQGPDGMIDLIAEDWPRFLDDVASIVAGAPSGYLTPVTRGAKATALAKAGRQKDAEATVAATPLDCSPCLIARGGVAEAGGDAAGADRWYAAAEKTDPDFPFANYQWGRTEVARGQLDRALAHLAAAHRKQPRWADPEAWTGRALLRKGDAAAALPHFAEAARFAPRWGGLHLWWGEALGKVGRAAEARAQFQAAAGMDLSVAERAELAAQGS